MNYFALVAAWIMGIALGAYFARRGRGGGLIERESNGKRENIKKILNFLRENGKIKNDDVEKITGVSNATAERYLDELEKRGEIIQHGRIGRGVFYTYKG